MKKPTTCIQCGETRKAIKLDGLFCGVMSNTEEGSEVESEWKRHRFKPYSVKEIASLRSDEEACIKEMGNMYESFINKPLKDN